MPTPDRDLNLFPLFWRDDALGRKNFEIGLIFGQCFETDLVLQVVGEEKAVRGGIWCGKRDENSGATDAYVGVVQLGVGPYFRHYIILVIIAST